MSRLSLATAIAEVRRELRQAMDEADPDFAFPVGQVTLSFQVGVTTSGSGSGKVKVWVLELGAEGSYARETIQTVAVVLEPPVDTAGNRLRVASERGELPG